MPRVGVSGPFDELCSQDVRFLEEAARCGDLTVHLWSDKRVQHRLGRAAKFPEAERLYFLRALRFVADTKLVDGDVEETAPLTAASGRPDVWVERGSCNAHCRFVCDSVGVEYRVLSEERLQGWPYSPPITAPAANTRKKVLVTGCYDWFHSGHIRFFEEVSAYGDVYVVVGHDANIRLLKGAGHPMFTQEERRYLVGSVRYVKQALISSGNGWLDAEPEIERLKPHMYAVNEDGDRGGKREYCAQRGIEYLVLKRTPAPGLPQRTSTNLRGF